MSAHVVATAGHVDHGKSALVQALTGTHPDRLAEEKRHGRSIDLGYCWTTLPPVGEVAIVDVPGHSRLVSTALAGIGPVSATLFVIAADDPWMPQAAEHLKALDGLGVEHGVLVVSRCDLADPRSALEAARAALRSTSLARIPSVTVSSHSGEGIDRLRRVLAQELASVPQLSSSDDVRLWVDRHFHLRGTGTVATGTLPAGTISIGDRLELDGHCEVRVRSLESHRQARYSIAGQARVAVGLNGRLPPSFGRGSILTTPGAFLFSSTVDVELRDSEAVLPSRPLLYLGSTQVEARTRKLAKSFWRLTLEQPLPLRPNDRALLRDPGRREFWGIRVIDPSPLPLRRRGDAARRAAQLSSHDGSLHSELEHRGIVSRRRLLKMGYGNLTNDVAALRIGDWFGSQSHVAKLRSQLIDIVDSARDQDESITVGTICRALELPDPRFLEVLIEPPLRLAGGRVIADGRPASPRSQSSKHAAACQLIAARLAGRPFSALTPQDLFGMGIPDSAVRALIAQQRFIKVDGLVMLPQAPDDAVEQLKALSSPFTASQARLALGSNRRVAIAVLGLLDARGHTVRGADGRRSVVADSPSSSRSLS